MSVEQAQLVRCDRCGCQILQRHETDCDPPALPADWLVLNWQAGPYEFAFCPGCTAAFVEFAAQSKAPRLYVVQDASL